MNIVQLWNKKVTPRVWSWEQPAVATVIHDAMSSHIDRFLVKLTEGSFSYNSRNWDSCGMVELSTFIAKEIHSISVYTSKKGMFNLTSSIRYLVPHIGYNLRAHGFDNFTKISYVNGVVSIYGKNPLKSVESLKIEPSQEYKEADLRLGIEMAIKDVEGNASKVTILGILQEFQHRAFEGEFNE